MVCSLSWCVALLSPRQTREELWDLRNGEFSVCIQTPPSLLSCSWASVNRTHEWVAISSEPAVSLSGDKGLLRSCLFCMGFPCVLESVLH